MDKADKETFKGIITGFEEYYRRVQIRDALPENPVVRSAFYNSCLAILIDGHPFKSPAVQTELVHYYTKLRDEAYAEIVSNGFHSSPDA